MAENTNYSNAWLTILGVNIGDEVMIVASGLGGSGFQGFLKSLVFAAEHSSEPLAIVLTETPESGIAVTIPWHAVIMFSKAKTPKAPPPSQSVQDLVAELDAKAAEAEAFADQ